MPKLAPEGHGPVVAKDKTHDQLEELEHAATEAPGPAVGQKRARIKDLEERGQDGPGLVGEVGNSGSALPYGECLHRECYAQGGDNGSKCDGFAAAPVQDGDKCRCGHTRGFHDPPSEEPRLGYGRCEVRSCQGCQEFESGDQPTLCRWCRHLKRRHTCTCFWVSTPYGTTKLPLSWTPADVIKHFEEVESLQVKHLLLQGAPSINLRAGATYEAFCGHEVFIKLTPGSTPIRVRANTTVDGIKKVLEEEHGVKIRSLWRGSVQLAGGSSPAAGTILEAKVDRGVAPRPGFLNPAPLLHTSASFDQHMLTEPHEAELLSIIP